MSPDATREVVIAMADDDEADRLMTRRALSRAGITNSFVEVSDGKALLELLRGQGVRDGAPRPDLVLLDLNMPGVDGRQVLEEIRADQALSDVTVVVLTASDDPEDIRRAYRLGAASYVSKPVKLAGLLRVAEQLEHFGVSIVRTD